MRIRALTLDLDDTLWPVAPALLEAERCIDRWLDTHHPEVARRYGIEAMRSLRDEVAAARPDLAHDFSAQRRETLARAFAACGIDEPPVEAAFEIYFAARNRVEPYADTLDALERLRRHLPLVSLSNGNADLHRIGMAQFFRDFVSAREIGVAKPDPAIFHAACARLDLPADAVLHVGDDPALDVAGARAAGLRTAWINREGHAWDHGERPDLELDDLAQLADWIESRATGVA